MRNEIYEFLKRSLVSLKTPGSFGRNLAITVSGNGLGYTIGFLLTPIIARIYLPQAYGEFALFSALVANISLLSTLDYHSAFVLTKSQTQLRHLVKLTLILVLMVSGITGVIFYFFEAALWSTFEVPGLIGWSWLIPVFVFFIGFNRCLEYFNVQLKKFEKNAKSKTITITSSKLISVMAGLITQGHTLGLIFGELLSKPLSSILLYGASIKRNLQGRSSLKEMVSVGHRYRNYPGYILPANLLQALSKQLPIYLLSYFFGSEVTGWFSLANSTLNVPILLMGTSAAYVFYQKAAEVQATNPEKLSRISGELFNYLSLLGVVPFGILFVFGDILFGWIFGDNWQTAGLFASYLSIMGFMQFISLSISSLFRIIRHERLQFQLNLAGAVVLMAGLLVGIVLKDAMLLVMIFAGIGMVLELIIIAVVFSKIGLSLVHALRNTVGYFLIVSLLLYFLRIWIL